MTRRALCLLLDHTWTPVLGTASWCRRCGRRSDRVRDRRGVAA